MPTPFTFKKSDPTLTRYLSPAEIAAITREQSSDNYVFEFHEGHETGNPVYVRPAGNKDKSNLPKFDTKNKTAASYGTTNGLANGEKLGLAPMKNKDRDDLIAVIQGNWALLSKLAASYYGKS